MNVFFGVIEMLQEVCVIVNGLINGATLSRKVRFRYSGRGSIIAPVIVYNYTLTICMYINSIFVFRSTMTGCTGVTSRVAAARACTIHTGVLATCRASTTVPTSGLWARATLSIHHHRHSRPTSRSQRALRQRPTSNATKTPFIGKCVNFFLFILNII